MLPDNFDLCVKRLDSLSKRLIKKTELFEEYDRVIKGQVKGNIVEKFISTLDIPYTGKIHFLSHHPVVRNDALTTKVRIVYNGSAMQSVNTPSLNNCLKTGPSLVRMIFDILLRFRCYKIPLVADVQQAFHQIRINREDVDYLRFSWVDNIHSDDPKLIFLRFLRVIFGLNCSQFLLSGTLQHNISQYRSEDPQLVAKLLKSIYVDDLMSGANSISEPFRLYLKSNLCLSDVSFYLRKWASSSEKLMRLIDGHSTEKEINSPYERVVSEDQPTYTKATLTGLEKEETNEGKVLGVLWNKNTDTLIFRFDQLIELARKLPPTKRNVLRLTASIFDPLGIISPVIMQMKLLFQLLCS